MRIINIPLSEINMASVNRQLAPSHVSFLANSIKEHGLLQPVALTKTNFPDGTKYRIVAGGHRVAAFDQLCKERGSQGTDNPYVTIPAILVEPTETTINVLQMVENVVRRTQTPSETRLMLLRVLAHPDFVGLSLDTVLSRLNLGKSVQWVRNILELGNLIPPLAKILDEAGSNANITSFIWIAKLPAEEQCGFLEDDSNGRPMYMLPVADVQTRVTTTLAALKARAKNETPVNDPYVFCRPRSKSAFIERIRTDFEAKMNSGTLSPVEKAYLEGILWACSMDPESVMAREAKSKEEKARKEAAQQRTREIMARHQANALEEIAALEKQAASAVSAASA